MLLNIVANNLVHKITQLVSEYVDGEYALYNRMVCIHVMVYTF